MKKLAQLSIISFFIGISLWFGLKWIKDNEQFKIKHIVLMTKVSEQNKNDLLQITRSNIDGNFFSLDINRLRSALESLEWIEQVSIRKVWSSSIQIRIKEKQVNARWVEIKKLNKKTPEKSWDKHSLISQNGKIFKPVLSSEQQERFSQYSLFSGPEELSETIMNKCNKMSEILTTIKFKLSNCILDQRRAWTLSVIPNQYKTIDENNEIRLVLGKSETNELGHLIQIPLHQSNQLEDHKIVKKVQQFVSLYRQALYKYRKNIEQIDMRYTNGFAIAWKEASIQQSNT